MDKYVFTVEYYKNGELTTCEVISYKAQYAKDKVVAIMGDEPYEIIVRNIKEYELTEERE